jgi:pericentrin
LFFFFYLRKALRDALRRLLDLFGDTLKAAVTLKSRISERAGLLLDHEDAADTSDARLAGTYSEMSRLY